MPGWFYILRLKSGALYIGATTDLNQRYKDHCSGKACQTTSLDPPVDLLYSEELETFSDARRREAQVKRWSPLSFPPYLDETGCESSERLEPKKEAFLDFSALPPTELTASLVAS